jgi:hypothetical protein
VARGAYGVALLLAPDLCQGGRRLGAGDDTSAALGRLLGARHLAEALLAAARPGPRTTQAGAAIDALHAISMLAWATLEPRRRRLALTAAAISSAFVAAGCYETNR